MKEILIILMSVILVDNFVLSKFLGICPFLGVSKKLDAAVGMSMAVTFVMIIATAVTYPIHVGLLMKYDLEYLQTIVFILVIASLVQLVEIVLKKYVPVLVNALGAGIGFLLAMVLFSGIRQKIEHNNIPLAFKGVPSILIAASIVALSFMGFGGVVEGLFV